MVRGVVKGILNEDHSSDLIEKQHEKFHFKPVISSVISIGQEMIAAKNTTDGQFCRILFEIAIVICYNSHENGVKGRLSISVSEHSPNSS